MTYIYQVTDHRNVTYVDPKHRAKFPGLGRKLDAESKYEGLKVFYSQRLSFFFINYCNVDTISSC